MKSEEHKDLRVEVNHSQANRLDELKLGIRADLGIHYSKNKIMKLAIDEFLKNVNNSEDLAKYIKG
ncbi:MAG: hypothetical protein FWH29_04290 [Methanobrevibacter sp.]|nr:hypothetical protein [Methanobrevibacter sp.]MCL2156657.1 hypothetical protein [Methanobrevibacter sp.]